MSLYTCELWLRDDTGWTCQEIRTGGSLRWGQLCGTDLLKPHAVTTTRYNYHRDTARAAFVHVCVKGVTVDTVEPEVCIVPSVGELGWSP